MNKLSKLVLSIGSSFAAGAIGSIATIPNIPTWYAALNKPSFSPPNWLFGPVWTLLYTLMGVALYLVWTVKFKGSKRGAYIAFGVQLVLNALWSLVFFGGHWLWGGVVVIAAMIVAIIATMWQFWPISKNAVYLLIPYLLWVCFATVLTVASAVLN